MRSESLSPAPRLDAQPSADDTAANRIPRSWALAFALAILAANLALAASVPADKDADELTLVLARGTLAHPPGFPLYTLLGHPFALALHAAGASWAFAANAWSALGGALAAFFAVRLADRLAGPRAGLSRLARFALAATPALLLCLNPMVTCETTEAEVYAWHLAWVLGASLLFVRSAAALASPGSLAEPARTRLAFAWGLAIGAGGAHHVTAILVALPESLLLLALLLRDGGSRLRPIVACLAGALLVLASYAAIFAAAWAPEPGDWIMFEPTWDGVLAHLRAQQYGLAFGSFAPSEIQQGFLARWIYPWLGTALAAQVIATLAGDRRERAVRWTLLVAALANVAFAFSLQLPDPVPYFLPALALSLAALAAPAAALAQRAGSRDPAGALALISLASLAACVPWIGVAHERKRAFEATDALIRDMWKSLPPGPGIVFFDDDMYLRLRGFQILAGERPELDVWYVVAFDAPAARRKFAARHGFDPQEGMNERLRVQPFSGIPEYLAWMRANVCRLSPVPVYEFDPRQRSVRLLRKPAG